MVLALTLLALETVLGLRMVDFGVVADWGKNIISALLAPIVH